MKLALARSFILPCPGLLKMKISLDLIIIAQTAFALAGESDQANEAGCDDYILKPYNREKLLEMMGHHVKKKKIN